MTFHKQSTLTFSLSVIRSANDDIVCGKFGVDDLEVRGVVATDDSGVDEIDAAKGTARPEAKSSEADTFSDKLLSTDDFLFNFDLMLSGQCRHDVIKCFRIFVAFSCL